MSSENISYNELAEKIVKAYQNGDPSAKAYLTLIANSFMQENNQVITKAEIEANLNSPYGEAHRIDITEPEGSFYSVPLKGRNLPLQETYSVLAEVRMLADNSKHTIRMENSSVRVGLKKKRGYDVLSDGSISVYTETGEDIARIIPQRYHFGRNNVIREFMSMVYHVAKGVEVLQWKNTTVKELEGINPSTHRFMSKLSKPSVMRSMLAMKGQMEYVHNIIAQEGFKYEILSESPFDLKIKEMPPHFNPYELADQLLESLPINISRIFIRNEDINCFVVLDGEMPKQGYGMLSDCEGILHGDRVIIFIVNKAGSLLEILAYNFGVQQHKTYELYANAAAEMWVDILRTAAYQSQISSMRRWVGYWDGKNWVDPQYDCDMQMLQTSEYIGPARPDQFTVLTSRPYTLTQKEESLTALAKARLHTEIGPEQDRTAEAAAGSISIAWMTRYPAGQTPRIQMKDTLSAGILKAGARVITSIVPVRPYMKAEVELNSYEVSEVRMRDTLTPVMLYTSEELSANWRADAILLKINSIISANSKEQIESSLSLASSTTKTGDTLQIRTDAEISAALLQMNSQPTTSIRKHSYATSLSASGKIENINLLAVSDTVKLGLSENLHIEASLLAGWIRDAATPPRLQLTGDLRAGVWTRAVRTRNEIRTLLMDVPVTFTGRLTQALSVPLKGASKIKMQEGFAVLPNMKNSTLSYLGIHVQTETQIGISSAIKSLSQNDKTAARKYKIAIPLRATNLIKGLEKESKLKEILELTSVSLSIEAQSIDTRKNTINTSAEAAIEASQDIHAQTIVNSLVETSPAEQQEASAGISSVTLISAGTSRIKDKESLTTEIQISTADLYNQIDKTYQTATLTTEVELYAPLITSEAEKTSVPDDAATTSAGIVSASLISSINRNQGEKESLESSIGLAGMVIISQEKTSTADSAQVAVGIGSIQFI